MADDRNPIDGLDGDPHELVAADVAAEERAKVVELRRHRKADPDDEERVAIQAEEAEVDRERWIARAIAAAKAGQLEAAHDALRALAFVGRREPIEVLHGAQLARPLPALEYLVREIGLVAEGGAPHMVAGYGFSGKTMAIQSLVLSLVTGGLVWGAYRCTKRRVLHIDLEQGARTTVRRYQRLAIAMGLDLDGLGKRLGVAAKPRLALAPSERQRWRDLMQGYDLVIVDSLRAATPGEDESGSAARAPLDMLGDLSEETKCRALVIHHARKASKDSPGGRYAIRGSSALFDACDSVYVFSAERGEPVSVEHVKARDHGELVEDWALVIDDVEVDAEPRAGVRVSMRGAELVTEIREQRAEQKRAATAERDAQRLLEVVRAHPGVGAKEARDAAVMNGQKFRAASELLIERGQLEIRVEGRTRAHYPK